GHSFNALLKTLEEPPPHVKFLLATTDPQKVPVTVLSRCLQFNLKRLPVEQIEAQFRHILGAEQVAFEPAALGVLARAADGSMRDGLSLLDQAIAFGGGAVQDAGVRAMLGVVATERLPELIAAVQRGEAEAAMAGVEAMSEHAPDFGGLLREMVILLHRIALLQQVPSAAQASWGEVGRLRVLAEEIPPEDVQLYYQIALNGQRDLPLAPDERSGFEMVMLRMLAFRPDHGDSFTDGGAGDRATVPEPPPRRPRKAVEGASPVPKAQVAAAKTEGVPPEPAGQGDTDFSDWHGFVRRLGLKGMAAQLAENCVFDAWDGRQLSLRLDPVCSGLIGSLAERRLQEAVTATAGQPVVLHLAVEASADETPAQREAREQRVRQEATEADISADPLVLGVQEAFDAEIVPDSIRRID
ncbi:MAG: DNA polymerase III subunit gamma/tau C-terminal domain-containing protein, partial [Sedimenticolaceae bacterium]